MDNILKSEGSGVMKVDTKQFEDKEKYGVKTNSFMVRTYQSLNQKILNEPVWIPVTKVDDVYVGNLWLKESDESTWINAVIVSGYEGDGLVIFDDLNAVLDAIAKCRDFYVNGGEAWKRYPTVLYKRRAESPCVVDDGGVVEVKRVNPLKITEE